MQDRLIIQLFWERSEKAIEELAKKYERLCYGTALRVLGNEQDAQECVNDAYLAVWEQIPPQKPDFLGAYVCRIVRNKALNRYAKNTAAKRDGAYDLVLDELAEVLAGGVTVEEQVLEKELQSYINDFLAGISGKDRVLFVQRYWFCREISEIARECGFSANYVNVRLHRIRERLKKYLKEEELIS